MTRTSPLVLIVAFALAACGNGAGEGDGNAGARAAPAAAASPPASAPPSDAAPAAQPAVAARLPLRPLSEADMLSSDETGCSCTFDSRNRTYLFTIGDELMVRTAAGLQVCYITRGQLQSFGESDEKVPCSDVEVSIRDTGERELSIESDSSSAPSTLTATQSGVTSRLDGSWGCAC